MFHRGNGGVGELVKAQAGADEAGAAMDAAGNADDAHRVRGNHLIADRPRGWRSRVGPVLLPSDAQSFYKNFSAVFDDGQLMRDRRVAKVKPSICIR